MEISSPFLTPSALALGEQVYVSVHTVTWCIYILEEVYPVLQAPCIEPFHDKTGQTPEHPGLTPWLTHSCCRWDCRFPVILSCVSCPVLSSWIAHLNIRRSHFPQSGLISPQKQGLNAFYRITERKCINEVLNSVEMWFVKEEVPLKKKKEACSCRPFAICL